MNNADYTKVIKIRFDNKNEYRINSYRAEEIRKQNKDERILIYIYFFKKSNSIFKMEEYNIVCYMK